MCSTFQFGSWTYDSGKVNLTLYNSGHDGFVMSDYITNNEWEITEYYSKRNARYLCYHSVEQGLKEDVVG